MDALEDTGGEEGEAQGSLGQEWAPIGRLHRGREVRRKGVEFPLGFILLLLFFLLLFSHSVDVLNLLLGPDAMILVF